MTKGLICEVCERKYSSIQPTSKTCSKECRLARSRKVTGREGIMTRGIATGTVGAMSEMRIAIHLMMKGYAVFRALSQHCYCDIIASKGDIIYKIECRTGYKHRLTDNISFSNNIQDKVDMFAIYVPLEDKVYFLKPDARTQIEII